MTWQQLTTTACIFRWRLAAGLWRRLAHWRGYDDAVMERIFARAAELDPFAWAANERGDKWRREPQSAAWRRRPKSTSTVAEKRTPEVRQLPIWEK